MYRTAQRTAGEHVWLGLSLALNLLGIAGIAEDALKWKSFLLSSLLLLPPIRHGRDLRSPPGDLAGFPLRAPLRR